MTLQSGTYLPDPKVTVVYWPKPDANGDGTEIWVEDKDPVGRSLGTNLAKDAEGNPVRRYVPPEGFKDFRNWEGVENYCLADERGQPKRNDAGEAISIKEGQALVLYSDGSVKVLEDEYAQYVFSQHHKLVEE